MCTHACARMMYVPHSRRRTMYETRARECWLEKENVIGSNRDGRKREKENERKIERTKTNGEDIIGKSGECERKKCKDACHESSGGGWLFDEDRASRKGGGYVAEQKERLRKRNSEGGAKDATTRTKSERRGKSAERENRAREYGIGRMRT